MASVFFPGKRETQKASASRIVPSSLKGEVFIFSWRPCLFFFFFFLQSFKKPQLASGNSATATGVPKVIGPLPAFWNTECYKRVGHYWAAELNWQESTAGEGGQVQSTIYIESKNNPLCQGRVQLQMFVSSNSWRNKQHRLILGWYVPETLHSFLVLL